MPDCYFLVPGFGSISDASCVSVGPRLRRRPGRCRSGRCRTALSTGPGESPGSAGTPSGNVTSIFQISEKNIYSNILSGSDKKAFFSSIFCCLNIDGKPQQRRIWHFQPIWEKFPQYGERLSWAEEHRCQTELSFFLLQLSYRQFRPQTGKHLPTGASARTGDLRGENWKRK